MMDAQKRVYEKRRYPMRCNVVRCFDKESHVLFAMSLTMTLAYYSSNTFVSFYMCCLFGMLQRIAGMTQIQRWCVTFLVQYWCSQCEAQLELSVKEQKFQ